MEGGNECVDVVHRHPPYSCLFARLQTAAKRHAELLQQSCHAILALPVAHARHDATVPSRLAHGARSKRFPFTPCAVASSPGRMKPRTLVSTAERSASQR